MPKGIYLRTNFMRNKRALTPDAEKLVKVFHASGIGLRVIARFFGVSHNTIARSLKGTR